MQKYLSVLVLAVVVMSTTVSLAEENVQVGQFELVRSGVLIDTSPEMSRMDDRVASVTEVDLDVLWEATEKDYSLRLKEGLFKKNGDGWKFIPIWKEKGEVIRQISIQPDHLNYWIVKWSKSE